MSWAFLEDVRDRMRRKPKPVTYIDMETRDVDGAICTGYKVGDGPVVMLPWEAACARNDWAEAERLQREMFAEIRRQHQLAHAADLREFNRSWLTRKFLTFAAWARTIFKR
jgi:hypothetical protein